MLGLSNLSSEQKRNLTRIAAAAVFLIALNFAPLSGIVRTLAYLVPYLIVGYDVLYAAAKNLKKGNGFDQSLLMAIATIGAFVLAVYEDGDYSEAVTVMLFFQVGEFFEDYAVGKSREDISGLMDIRPDFARLVHADGKEETVDPETVAVGAQILVKPGERVPIDGVILEGKATLDTRALTGESLPRKVGTGDAVLSGCINTSSVLIIRTTKAFTESTASKILTLVEDAGLRKSKSEAFITRFARIYTPIVVYSAILLAFAPPIIRLLVLGADPAWGTWIYRSLTFLIISCPCALVISVPLSFFAGIGAASRKGVLIKGSNYMEALAGIDTVVFDKTGTLTKGVFDVTAVHPEKQMPDELLHLAAHVEHFSTHPIATALREAFPCESDGCMTKDIEEVAGAGITAVVNGRHIVVGNATLMEHVGAKWHPCDHVGTIVHVAIDGIYAGHIVISDEIKTSAKDAIAALRKTGVRQTVMLTGDQKDVAASVAGELGIDTVYSELLPQDKVAKVESLIAAQKKGEKLAFVGDGINDAPVLSRADVGIAMGAMGSDAAIEAADIVLMDDDPMKISVACRIAKKTLSIVYQNIIGAIGIKICVLILGALGLANMWAAVFADVGVMVICVINAMRTIFTKKTVHRERKETAAKDTYKIAVDCPNCAAKMEDAANKTEGVKRATINFMALKMKVEFEDGADAAEVMPRVRANCKKVEDDCEVFF